MNRLVRNRSLCGETRRPSLQGRSGFTLTELLVTMAIIALLLGLLLPGLGIAREWAGEMQWRNDLKALALAMWMYAQDHQGSFPKVTRLDEAVQQVLKALEPYLKDKKLISRLGSSGRTWLRYTIYPKTSLNFMKLDQIHNPGCVPIGGELWYTINPKTSLNSLEPDQMHNPGRVPIGGEQSPGLDGKDPLVIFADGHVERMKREDLNKALLSSPVAGGTTGGVTSPSGQAPSTPEQDG